MPLNITISNQPLELFTPSELAIVTKVVKPINTQVLDMFFPNSAAFNNRDDVPLEQLDTTEPLAPFVSPMAQGKPLVQNGSYERNSVQAAYLKPAVTITPQNVYDLALIARIREAGIISNNTQLTLEEKLRVAQIAGFDYLHRSIVNRKVLMGIDILTTGKTVIIGDDAPQRLVDFGRHADLKWAPSVKWGEANATPVSDIETLNGLLADHGGVSATDALMSSKVFTTLGRNAEFKERFVVPNGANAPSPFTPQFNRTEGLQYRGEIDGIRFWTFDESHKLNGTEQRYIDSTGFYLIADRSGYQAQCMIQHLEANGTALEFFDYQVVQSDPSAIKLITDSSPLLVPSNVNGVAGGTGFVA